MRLNHFLIAAIVVFAVSAARAGQPGGPGGQGGPRGPEVPAGVKVERDLAYAGDNDRKHKLDLYLPEKAEKPLPLLIWIYGGGWAMGDKVGRSPAVQLAAEGYAVACINYRLSDQARFPAQIQDCKAAVRWLRANAAKYNIDPDHFGTWGGSAGGHLAALTGTSGGSKEFEPIGGNADVSDRVQAVCDQYGPTDLLKMDEQAGGRGAFKHDDAKSPEGHLIGGPIQENKEKTERANPIKYITKECPPFLIMHGDADNMVPIGQSEILLDALKKQGIEASLITVRSGHGGPVFDQPANVKVVKDFFDKHFKNAAAASGTGARGTAGQGKSGKPAPNAQPNRPQRPEGAPGPQQQGGMDRQGGPGAATHWLPEGISTVRVIVLGRHFLPPNGDWQAFAKKYSVGIASCIEALPAMATETKHPEIETAPIVTTGISAGGLAATQTALRYSDRILAVIPIHGAMLAQGNDGFNANRGGDTPGDIQTLDVEKLLKVPMALTFDDGDGFVSPVTSEGFVRYGRSKGAPWLFLLSKGGNHTDSTEDFSKALLPWLGAVIEARLPASASGQDAATRFTELAESSGWLGDLRTKEIATFADFKGDKAKANWFPNEDAAKAWKSHAMAPTYSIPDQLLKEPSGLIADFAVYDKSNSDTTTGKGWRINANFKEADQLSNNIRYFVAGPVPKIIEGCDWIRTMNGGKVAQPISADPPFSFTVTADCIVYIAHGDQEQGKVAWLSGWTDTQQTVNACGGMLEKPVPMKIYSKKFLKGEKVTPGANSSQPRPHGLMYIALVGQATAAGAEPGGKGDTAAEAKSIAAKTDASEAAAAKAEKTLAGVQERLTQLQTEQSRLDMEVLKAQQKVNESRAETGGSGTSPGGRGANPAGRDANPGGRGPNPGGPGPNPGGRGTNFGGRDPNMPPGQGTLRAADSLEYRKACVSAAQQYQVLDTKCLSLVKTMQGLAKESPGLSAELQARISETAAKVAARRRAILEKIGSLYVSAGEWKIALAAYMQVYKDIPEDQRAKESNLMGTLADLCEKVQDYKAAAFFYKSILDGLPEGQRWRNRALCDKLCRALEQAGDLKSALAVYKSMLEALPPNVRDGDRGPATDLNRRIENLERQLGGKQ